MDNPTLSKKSIEVGMRILSKNDQEDHEEATDGSTEQAQSTQNAASTVNNHPLFIQQNGDGNTVISNHGTITINIGKK